MYKSDKGQKAVGKTEKKSMDKAVKIKKQTKKK
jgi:hypothetical protein